MEAQEFLNEIDSIVEIIKKREQAEKGKSIYRRKTAPEFYKGYNEQLRKYRKARIQAYGEFPEEIFKAIAPLQTDEEFEYIKSIYETETQDVFTDFCSVVKKSVTNGVIEFPTSESNEANNIAQYLDSEINNFDNYNFSFDDIFTI